MMRGAISKFFPVADHEMTKAAACMFTTTQDSHFIVDLHPKHEQVQPHIAANCSSSDEHVLDEACGSRLHELSNIHSNVC